MTIFYGEKPFVATVATQKTSESRGSEATGLVSILTSDTDYALALPCAEYLRLKRLQKSVRISAEVIQESLQKNHVRYKAAMVTLTYRDDVDWSPRQVSNYLKCVREWARRKGIFIHYVWVLELTKRGRPHYHILFTGNDIAARVFVSAARYIVYNYLSTAEKKKANLWMINVRNVKQIATDKKKLVAYVMKQIKYMTKNKNYEYDKNTGEIKDGFRYWGRNYTPKDSEISHGKYLNENDIEYIRYQIALAKFFPKTIYFENDELELNGDTIDYCNFPLPY